MILHFPTIDTLRLAVTSGLIPDAVRATAARFAFDEDQSLWVEPAVPPSARAVKDLRCLGVHFPRISKITLAQEAVDWLQMLPLSRDRHAIEPGDKTPILIELPRPGQLAEIATEILRLGNDRQSFCCLDDGTEPRTLLRVIGPPYYTLLRAIDRESEEGAPIAYREVAPRLWIQIGYSHPVSEHLRPPAGHLLLMRPPHRWTSLPEPKFRDIYEVFDFQFPQDNRSWQDVALAAPVPVPVKLTRRGASEAAELWRLGEEGIAQLEELVRSSDNDLLARLAFAVGELDGSRLVVLRVRPSKNAPPVLVLHGLALRSYLRIPNLFVPVGMGLYPPLRRDAVVRLLAEDKERIHWLVPHEDSTFTPESLPDNAFRPLSEWVDYVLQHEHHAIAAWLGATQFDFEGFICSDDEARPKKPTKHVPKQPAKPDTMAREDVASGTSKSEEIAPPKPENARPSLEEEVKIEPGDLHKRLREIEAAFAALATPLDDPARAALWREMAELNGSLQQHGDAAICWANALWEQPSIQPDWPLTWFRRETNLPIGSTPAAAPVLRVVNADLPTHANVRQVAAYLIWAAALATPPAELRPHLSKVQRYLEKHEAYLGVRAAWLAWHALYHLSGGDVLMLARARDRLLERLYFGGLTPQLDLPGFLRFSSVQTNQRFRIVRDQVVRLRRLVDDWAKAGTNATPATHAYIDLIFAFGLARLGEGSEALKLMSAAAQTLQHADEIHSWLYEAFEFRVRQALDAGSRNEALPDKLLLSIAAIEHPEYVKHMPEEARKKVQEQLRLQRYKIDRLRQVSRILEPHESLDPYRHWHGRFADALAQELVRLTDIHDREELRRGFEQLLAGKQKFKGIRDAEPRILVAALELAPRLGQSFGEELLDRAAARIAKAKDAQEVAVLLEKGLFLAAHFDRQEDVQRFALRFQQLLQSEQALPYDKRIPLFSASLRSLRKFGLRDLAEQLMQRLGEMVAADQSLPAGSRGKQLGLMLELAAGWFAFGADAKARQTLDQARAALLGNDLMPVDRVELACAYLTALGQAPLEFAVSRIMEFFRKVDGIYDNWTTVSHYSLSRLKVVEAMILALISDDFTLDREARQRLDDDEFLVRRRIHRDMRMALSAPLASKG